jgi:IPT/TIG domain-containing protein
VPAGKPGHPDIAVTTSNGTSTLPRALFYAQSVKDYPSSDRFTAILYDRSRNQLYLSAGDHIDVFSLGSNQFTSSLAISSQGTLKQLAGLALTPDGNLLLATDLLDGSLAVISPESPTTSSYAIPIVAPFGNGNPGCTIGPMYVQAAINYQAYVATGGLPGIGCGPGGSVFLVNLTSHTATPASLPQGCGSTATSIASSLDGTKVFFTSCIYDVLAQRYYFNAATQGGAALSGDGNVAASFWSFSDGSGNAIGVMARPDIEFGTIFTTPGFDGNIDQLQQPRLNDAGSLYFISYSNAIDMVDVEHGALRMRFFLDETISNTAAPIAIDSGGRHIYAITNKGLTIVDLGQALLSIGSINPSMAPSSAQIKIRGSGFSTSTTATVGGQPASVSFTDENTLTLIVPNVPSGPADVVLVNNDGDSYRLENALTIP